jgi:hypothetical protein
MKLAPQVTQLKKRQRFPKALVIKPLMQLNGYRDDDEDSLISENDNYDNDNKHIPTKFAVDRMEKVFCIRVILIKTRMSLHTVF